MVSYLALLERVLQHQTTEDFVLYAQNWICLAAFHPLNQVRGYLAQCWGPPFHYIKKNNLVTSEMQQGLSELLA